MIKDKILFLDIETVPVVYQYNDLDSETQKLWDKKWRYMPDSSGQEQYNKAGIFAEFSKIVCISCGFFHHETFRIKSFYGDDEKVILNGFTELLLSHFNDPVSLLCGHNIKEFDIPFIARRILINGLPLPDKLNVMGKKPWETSFLDTLEMWKFGDFKNFTSLELLAHVFGIPTPKSDIDGSEVAKVYYEEKDIVRIAKYCSRDVVTVARLLLKLKGMHFDLSDDKMVIQNLELR